GETVPLQAECYLRELAPYEGRRCQWRTLTGYMTVLASDSRSNRLIRPRALPESACIHLSQSTDDGRHVQARVVPFLDQTMVVGGAAELDRSRRGSVRP